MEVRVLSLQEKRKHTYPITRPPSTAKRAARSISALTTRKMAYGLQLSFIAARVRFRAAMRLPDYAFRFDSIWVMLSSDAASSAKSSSDMLSAHSRT